VSTVQGILGLIVMVAFAWAIAERRRMPPWKLIGAGLALQFALALILLRLPLSREMFLALNGVVTALQAATTAGTSFVFGYLGGAAPPFEASSPGAAFILALQALPLVLLISALSALLYHWRVLPVVVRGFAWALEKSLGVGGAASLATAANIFVGMVEAPLLIKPYVERMSRSDLFLVMAAGMSTIAGTVMVLYATFLRGIVADPIGHLLTASILSAPAAVVIARLMVPEADGAEPVATRLDRLYDGAMDAVTRGTADGLRLLLNIIAMLVVLVALVHLANAALGLFPEVWGAKLTLERALGWVMAPLAWLMGIPWSEAGAAGALLGVKIVLNELIAYLSMARLPEGTLSPHSRLIMTYALCGFANFASLGIMIGGLGAMVPERRAEIVSLGLKSIVAGTLATCMTATVVGLL
jgi:CNT family concentrative nucleoside transporter